VRTQVKHWQDAMNLVLAVCLGVSPWMLSFSDETRATWNAVVLGALIAAASIVAIYNSSVWALAAMAVFGAWLIVSPWVLDFSGHSAAMLSALIVGVAVFALAGWRLGSDKSVGWFSPAH